MMKLKNTIILKINNINIIYKKTNYDTLNLGYS